MRLTKHHGLGNDFLVLLDLDGEVDVDASLAVAVCDRHRGVGADGLLHVTRGVVEPFAMVLRNFDGSRAEMSGNGISCLAQALVRADLVPADADGVRTARIRTDAGLRVVTVVDGDVHACRHRMRVAMGTPVVGDHLPEWVGDDVLDALAVDVGNPHVVLRLADPDRIPDVADLGRRIDAATPGGANVELVASGADGDPAAVRMVVWERGVGPTEACGTGAVASATAARAWGLVPATATVHQPGGPATVELGEGPGAEAHLTVPVVAVAEVTWHGA